MKLKYTLSFFLLIVILFMIGCDIEKKQDKFSQVIEIIEVNSIRIDSINWDNIKKEAITEIRNKKRDTNHQIKTLIKKLHDNHSFFIPRENVNKFHNNNNREINIEFDLLQKNIGYIKIPSFTGKDSLACAFSEEILDKIVYLDTKNVQNWIIDLRNNRGGNMYPMLLGIHPLLREGIKGHFIQKNDTLSWSLEKANVLYQDKIVINFSKPYHLKNKVAKIAILINENTASSAEALAISFIGMKNIKLIGDKTKGLTTGNSTFKLNDGSMLVLTTSIFADRNKKKYGHKIIPDIYSKYPKKEAIKWIHQDDQVIPKTITTPPTQTTLF